MLRCPKGHFLMGRKHFEAWRYNGDKRFREWQVIRCDGCLGQGEDFEFRFGYNGNYIGKCNVL